MLRDNEGGWEALAVGCKLRWRELLSISNSEQQHNFLPPGAYLREVSFVANSRVW
jgi:hypothetical protein